MLNYLSLLGWNDGSEQEIYSVEELQQAFSLDRITKSAAGARAGAWTRRGRGQEPVCAKGRVDERQPGECCCLRGKGGSGRRGGDVQGVLALATPLTPPTLPPSSLLFFQSSTRPSCLG